MSRSGIDAEAALVRLRPRLRELADGRTRLIGIDGFGATGKTTFADRLAAQLPGAVVVHIDDFAHPDLPAWDRARFLAEVIEPLRAGRTARYRVGAWNVGDLTGAPRRTIPPGVPVVVEGVSSTDQRLGIDWDLRIWLDADREVRLARARERDGEAMLDTWLERWMPSEEAYAKAQRPRDRADMVVRT
ncbi:uridine kinase family protein [Naumannella huperziae]